MVYFYEILLLTIDLRRNIVIPRHNGRRFGRKESFRDISNEMQSRRTSPLLSNPPCLDLQLQSPQQTRLALLNLPCLLLPKNLRISEIYQIAHLTIPNYLACNLPAIQRAVQLQEPTNLPQKLEARLCVNCRKGVPL